MDTVAAENALRDDITRYTDLLDEDEDLKDTVREAAIKDKQKKELMKKMREERMALFGGSTDRAMVERTPKKSRLAETTSKN